MARGTPSRARSKPLDVCIRVHHPSLNLLSDQTIRRLLKQLAVVSRRAQLLELRRLLEASELESSHVQSIMDRTTASMGRRPAYYIERFERGSLTVAVVLASTGACLYLLDKAFGDVITEASRDVAERLLKLLKTNLWGRRVAERTKALIQAEGLGERFETEVTETVTQEYFVVNVRLDTVEGLDVGKLETKFDMENAVKVLSKVTRTRRVVTTRPVIKPGDE